MWELIARDPVGAPSIALFIVLSFVYLLREERLPNVFELLVALSPLSNAFGFVFDLCRAAPLYDEIAYAVTVFSLSLASVYLFYRDEIPPGRTLALGTAVFTLGVTAGSLWEIAEWTTGYVFSANVVFGLGDAMSDLVAKSVGALGAAFAALAILRGGAGCPRFFR